jgi:hypothetical protein
VCWPRNRWPLHTNFFPPAPLGSTPYPARSPQRAGFLFSNASISPIESVYKLFDFPGVPKETVRDPYIAIRELRGFGARSAFYKTHPKAGP